MNTKLKSSECTFRDVLPAFRKTSWVPAKVLLVNVSGTTAVFRGNRKTPLHRWHPYFSHLSLRAHARPRVKVVQQAPPPGELLHNKARLRVFENPQQIHHERVPRHLLVDRDLRLQEGEVPAVSSVQPAASICSDCLDGHTPPSSPLHRSKHLGMATGACGIFNF